ncbi:uncharacterized protein F5147DRAFT_660459 [Suillus discolor]|uniref:Uncharacterized protein n=1 Tax=Suillus discolor TaxID=1912936 RepID=A0A9P7JL81_9AGAM|nr:uncharacterized protein F5147DRAFT_660459 [Suillus discolor]KAG2082551.1 hypothetical protein F5147DRAFT_660459 [Suillus discolor]
MPDSGSNQAKDANTQPALTPEELVILQSYVKQWESAAGEDRNQVWKDATLEARYKAPTKDKQLLEKQKKVYRNWLHNHGGRKQDHKPPINMGRRWTYHWVIDTLRKRELLNKIQDDTGAVKTAEEWNSQGVPPEVQIDIAKKKSESMVHHFTSKMYKWAGMRVFVLAARKTEEGKLLVTGHDYNDEFGGAESFTKTCDWQVILPEWEPYVTKLFDGDGEDECVVHKAGRKDNTYMLDIGDSGVPVLPNYDKMDSGTRKAVVRAFLNWHYAACSGRPKDSVPWKELSSRKDEMLPRKMNWEEATALLKFWYNRQEASDRHILKFSGWWCKDQVKSPVKPVASDTEEELTVRSSKAEKTKKSLSRKTSWEKMATGRVDDDFTGSSDDERVPEKVPQCQVQLRKTRQVVEESWEDSEADSNGDEPRTFLAQLEDSSEYSQVEEPEENVKPPAKKPWVKQNPGCKIGPASRTAEIPRRDQIQHPRGKEGTSSILPNPVESASAPAPSGKRPAPVPTLNKPGPNKKRARADPDEMNVADASPAKHTRSQTKKPAPAKRMRKATRR